MKLMLVLEYNPVNYIQCNDNWHNSLMHYCSVVLVLVQKKCSEHQLVVIHNEIWNWKTEQRYKTELLK